MTHVAAAPLPNDLDTLAQCLASEAAAMQEFIAALEDESQVLATPAVGDALDATTARKNQLATTLVAAAQARTVLLQAMGLPSQNHELGAVLRQHPQLKPAIDQLVALAQHAQVLNSENGLIIEAYQRHNQQAQAELQALLGLKENRLYDASGRTKPTHGTSPTSIKAG